MKRASWLVGGLSLGLLVLTPAAQADHKGDESSGEAKTIQGCLGDGPADGWYVLTVKKGEEKEQVKVRGNASFEGHIGHEVKLTGSWVEEGGKHFNATAMQHVAGSCG
jgi:hypothetical protein